MRMVDMLACGSVACGRVGVWTWMCCVRMRMSRKEKEKPYLNADGWIADQCCVWTRWHADVDGSGC